MAKQISLLRRGTLDNRFIHQRQRRSSLHLSMSVSVNEIRFDDIVRTTVVRDKYIVSDCIICITLASFKRIVSTRPEVQRLGICFDKTGRAQFEVLT